MPLCRDICRYGGTFAVTWERLPLRGTFAVTRERLPLPCASGFAAVVGNIVLPFSIPELIVNHIHGLSLAGLYGLMKTSTYVLEIYLLWTTHDCYNTRYMSQWKVTWLISRMGVLLCIVLSSRRGLGVRVQGSKFKVQRSGFGAWNSGLMCV